MNIFPAIDLYDGKAVRLFKGDYNQMTVYNENPLEVAKDFENAGAKFIHLVDLEGAKFGTTPNIEVIKKIVDNTNLFTEIGGGIRSIETVDAYLNAGLDRVIIGTAAVTDEEFLNIIIPFDKKMDKYLIKYMYEYVAHYFAVGYEMSALWECTIEQQVNSALTRFTDPLLDGIFNYDKLDKILKDKYKLKIVDRKTSQMIKL